MKIDDLFEDGRIVKGVNTTADVDVNQIPKEVSKFGNKVDKDGRPPTLSKKVKGSNTNVLYNLGLAEQYTPYEIALMEGGHEVPERVKKEPGDIYKALEGKALKNPKNTFLTKSDTAYDFLRIGGNIANIKDVPTGKGNVDEPDVMISPYGGKKEKDYLKKQLNRIGYKTQDADKKGDDAHVDEGIKSRSYRKGYHAAKQSGRRKSRTLRTKFSEGYRLQLERGQDMDVLHITNTLTGKRTEVRGKPDYERKYDPNDKLHQLLDQIGKAANISDLINGEPVGINPKHPDGKKAKVATDVAYNEAFVKPQFDVEWDEATRYPEFKKLGKKAWIKLASKGKAVTIKNAKDINNTDAADPDSFKSLDKNKQARALAQLKSGDVEMPIVAVYSDGYKELIGGNTRLTAMMAQNGKATVWQFEVPDEVAELAENFADGKKKGKSRPGRVKRAGASCNGSVTSLRKRAKNSSGEKARMYHWCANMKSGRKKK